MATSQMYSSKDCTKTEPKTWVLTQKLKPVVVFSLWMSVCVHKGSVKHRERGAAKHLPGMCEARGSIFNTTKQSKAKNSTCGSALHTMEYQLKTLHTTEYQLKTLYTTEYQLKTLHTTEYQLRTLHTTKYQLKRSY